MGSRMHLQQIQHGPPLSYKNDVRAHKKEYADSLDAQDPLRHLRKEFLIPSKKDLTRKELPAEKTYNSEENDAESCIYLCGNSLGLQPRRTSVLIDKYLRTWGMKGVNGHFQPVENSPLEPWLDIDAAASKQMSHVISALPSEIAIMGTLTANLHLLLAGFYRPTTEKYKILLEGKAFPSDHYAVESQIINHKLDPTNAMILISSPDSKSPCIPTSEIYKAIDAHAKTTAVLLLPGVQFYTGQFLDVKEITAYAQEKGIIVGWDLAHAVGNVELALHDWNVDFAVWCSYKYLNSGPGAIGGLFVHERHGQVNKAGQFKPRLSGWWGAEKGSRFRMDNHFIPIPGAAGYQLSNPSALDLTAFQASISVFQETDMSSLRKKSKGLTGYLEHLLLKYPIDAPRESKPWKIITPSNPDERGAQLSILLEPGLLDTVMEELSKRSVVIDERKPDVIRVAPAPLYNSFSDVWLFVDAFRQATAVALEKRQKAAGT